MRLLSFVKARDCWTNKKNRLKKSLITKKVVLLQPLNPPYPLKRGKHDDSVAQQVEHNTFNVGVLGSSPSRVTKRNKESLIDMSVRDFS